MRVFALRYVGFAGAALALVTLFRDRLRTRNSNPSPSCERDYSLLTILVLAGIGKHVPISFNVGRTVIQLSLECHVDVIASG